MTLRDEVSHEVEGRCSRRIRRVSNTFIWYLLLHLSGQRCAAKLLSRDEVRPVSCLTFSFPRHLGRSQLSLIPAGCRASDTNQSTRSGSALPKQSFLRCSSLPKKVPSGLTMVAYVGELS